MKECETIARSYKPTSYLLLLISTAMQNFTFILAGVLGVGKTTIFKRIETGEFVQTPNPASVSKSDVEIEHFLYTHNNREKEFKVSH